jgi:hypothetical protein
MSKKDLSSLTGDLSALAAGVPTQRPVVAPGAPPPAPARSEPGEPVIQFSLSLRKSLRKQLARLADDADMTMRAFVLDALKARGLDVRADDLTDLRKDRR